jgi:hypothetical protein
MLAQACGTDLVNAIRAELVSVAFQIPQAPTALVQPQAQATQLAY